MPNIFLRNSFFVGYYCKFSAEEIFFVNNEINGEKRFHQRKKYKHIFFLLFVLNFSEPATVLCVLRDTHIGCFTFERPKSASMNVGFEQKKRHGASSPSVFYYSLQQLLKSHRICCNFSKYFDIINRFRRITTAAQQPIPTDSQHPSSGMPSSSSYTLIFLFANLFPPKSFISASFLLL